MINNAGETSLPGPGSTAAAAAAASELSAHCTQHHPAARRKYSLVPSLGEMTSDRLEKEVGTYEGDYILRAGSCCTVKITRIK